jgi:prepilin-type N-terminal cleavage/methylation domain-containing protein
MTAMHTASSFRKLPLAFPGFTLMEMLTVLGLLATLVSVATPWLQQWVWRLQVETVVYSWTADLQAARLQAMRSGQALRLQRSSQCQSAPLANGDWRCGWQLLKAQANNPTVLVNTLLAGEVLVNISPAQNNLDINALGEPVAGGLRVVVQAKRSPNASSVRAICINTAGRLRVIKGSTCA